MNERPTAFSRLSLVHGTFLALPGDAPFAMRLAGAADGTLLPLATHTFPDGETYLRLEDPNALAPQADIAIVASLRDPNQSVFPLLLLADAARQWGAKQVGLVAPYLPYMRQDASLRSGEAITARSFGGIISSSFDWLVTVDPHLHRIHRLGSIYSVPTRVVHSAPAIGAWIGANVISPVIVGPDAESRQWVEEVAGAAHAPFTVLRKTRLGDADVSITMPGLEAHRERVPVLVDDIISTGTTMAVAVRGLIARGMARPICVGVHAVFADGTCDALQEAGAELVVTSNTIPHFTNRIDVVPLLAHAVPQTPLACQAN